MTEYSAIIAGGGPAGAAAAIALLRSGHSVLLVERSRYDAWRIGETLPPEARFPLQVLGVWERFLSNGHLPSHAIRAAWGGAEMRETDFIYNPCGTGWHLDRRRFDEMLADHAAGLGAIVLRGARVTAAVWHDGHWRICTQGATTDDFRSSFLIDATGRGSSIAALTGVSRLVFDRTICAAATFVPFNSRASADPLLLLEAAEDGWWYSAPLEDGTLMISYITDPDLFIGCPDRDSAWLRKLRGAGRTHARTEGFRMHGSVRLRSAGPSRAERAGGPGWIAVGDAAATHDPLSADGITKALIGGMEAARIFHEGEGAPLDYARTVAESFDRYMEERCQYYRWETRWPDSVFWRRRHDGPQKLRSRSAS